MSTRAWLRAGPTAGQGLYAPRNDRALRVMAARGDADAFGALYQRHRHALYRYCQSILGHDDDARDALHNAMAKAWAAIGRAERDVPVRPWLFRIAHNEALNVLRDRREHRQLDDARVSSAESLEETIDVRQRLAVLRADLAALPERQRSALLLRELCGLRHNEIAAVLAITPAAARQTIYEARVGLHEAEAGRQMACAAVQRALSDGDGKVRRRRRIRSHLRACPACASFDEALRRRPSELASLVGPLPLSPVGLLLRLLSESGASSATSSAVAKLSSGLAANLAVGSIVLTVGGVASLDTSTRPRPTALPAAARATATVDVAGGLQPYLPAELRDGFSHHAHEPATPKDQTLTPPQQEASVAGPAAAHAPSEAPPAGAAGEDAAASDPVVVATAHVDAQHATPAQHPAAKPSSSATADAPPAAALASVPGVPVAAPSEPSPTRPAPDPRTATLSSGSGEPNPARASVEQSDRGPNNAPDEPHPARPTPEQPDHQPNNPTDEPHPARPTPEQPDHQPNNRADHPRPTRAPVEQAERRPNNGPKDAPSPSPADDPAGRRTDGAAPQPDPKAPGVETQRNPPPNDAARSGPVQQPDHPDGESAAPPDAERASATRDPADRGGPPRSAASERP
jgi:RNA polymerase sigma factor (sigma-70 family)